MLALLLATVLGFAAGDDSSAWRIEGVQVTPHAQSPALRWRQPPDPVLAARVQLFIRNTSSAPLTLHREEGPRFDRVTAAALLAERAWAWHDTPSSWLDAADVSLPPGALTVLEFNGKSAAWSAGTRHVLGLVPDETPQPFSLDRPEAWLSAVTFRSVEREGQPADAIRPNQVIVHLVNGGDRPLQVRSLALWESERGGSHRVFASPRVVADLACFPSDGRIPGGSRGGFVAWTGPLGPGHAVVEVRVGQDDGGEASLWARLRIKPEVFDISGGWVASEIQGHSSLTHPDYLKTLARMHINTGQHQEVGGYTDVPALFEAYPLKRFSRLEPIERYDTDALLPQIHAVEFLGEPQYGGGRPVPPQEVWEALAPYGPSRLATTVTLSEERTWRDYAGLSDFAHFNAYRVIAPAADAWTLYDRWDGQTIRWGAPLETIGAMTRSLRALNRPCPIACWSQGAHDGWGGFLSPRRRSPTPDELRAQAWQALANRITSLYWFNLSVKSLVAFPDLIEPITRVNREIRLVDDILIAGEATAYERLSRDGRPDWDLNVVATPDTALVVAHDLAYWPDPVERVFQFGDREATLRFPIPDWIEPPWFVFTLDADGPRDVRAQRADDGWLVVFDRVRVVGIWVVTRDPSLRDRLRDEHAQYRSEEERTGFNPGGDPADLDRLRALLAE